MTGHRSIHFASLRPYYLHFGWLSGATYGSRIFEKVEHTNRASRDIQQFLNVEAETLKLKYFVNFSKPRRWRHFTERTQLALTMT